MLNTLLIVTSVSLSIGLGLVLTKGLIWLTLTALRPRPQA
jgi:hypothetical protein